LRGTHLIHTIFRDLKFDVALCVVGEKMVVDPMLKKDVMDRSDVKKKENGAQDRSLRNAKLQTSR